MTDRLDLPSPYRKVVEALLREHVPDAEVWAYGSRVNGMSHPGSDLDLVLRSPTLEQLGDGYYALIEAFQESNIPILIQAHDWARLPEYFHREIERDCVIVQEGAKQTTAGKWHTATVGEIAEKVAMGPFGSSIRVETFVPEGVPIISGQHLHGFRVDDAPGFNCISHEHAERLSNANVRRGDIVLTHRGTIGQVACIPEDSQFDRYVVSQSQFYMRCDRSKAIPEFVTMYFRSPQGQHQLLANTSQVGVPSIAQPVTYLRTIEIPLPSLSEQRAIAHILGTLDDKIELNRRMNETLEAMARALFQSWFVDFDPVRAKMEGRDIGLPPDLAALFPDRLVDSELGLIPEGWGVRALDRIATFLNGLALQKYPATNGSVLPVVKIAQLRAGHALGADSASGDIPPQYVVHDGDVLFSWSGSLELDVWSGGEGALNQHLFKVTSEEYPQWLYYRWVREHLPGFRRIAAGKTTTMGHIQRHHLSEALTVIPPMATLKAMDCYMQPLVNRTLALRIDSRALATQRDALLPRLVSGEVRLS